VVDEYDDEPGRPAKDKRIFGYDKYAYVTLRDHTILGMTSDMTEILATVSLVRTNGKDATREPL
jgi:hypothetical protein